MSAHWAKLAAGLAAELSTLGGPEEVDTVLIIADRADSDCYVQFSGTASALWAEVVSNNHLPTHRQLTAADERALVAAGWRKPGRGLPNWWTDTAEPGQAAAMVVAAIRDQLRIAPHNLVYESFRTASGEAVTHPGLGIRPILGIPTNDGGS